MTNVQLILKFLKPALREKLQCLIQDADEIGAVFC